MMNKRPSSDDDPLIREAIRLRDELKKTATKLEVFADQLAIQARELRQAALAEKESDGHDR